MRSSAVSGWLVCSAKRREASSLLTLLRPVDAQMEAALADHAVAKLVRGPTCTPPTATLVPFLRSKHVEYLEQG